MWVDSGVPSGPSEAVWSRMSLPAFDGAAIFFAPSKAGSDIRLHTASDGPLGTPLSTHIHPRPVAAFAVTVRSRTPEALSPRGEKGPLTRRLTGGAGL